MGWGWGWFGVSVGDHDHVGGGCELLRGRPWRRRWKAPDTSQTHKARGLPHGDHVVAVWGLGADKVGVAVGHTDGARTAAEVVVRARLFEGGAVHVIARQRELK